MSPRAVPALNAADRAALVTRRIEQILVLLERHGAGGALLDTRRDFSWLTIGGQNHILYTTEVGVAPILVTRNDAVVIAPVNEFDRIAEEELAGLPLHVDRVPWFAGSASQRASEIVGSAKLLTASELGQELVALRSVLNAHEHARMEWLADVVGDVISIALAEVKSGTSEDEVVAAVGAAFAQRAVRLPVVLVAADDRITRYRHPLSASRPIHERVMLVVVAERWGLHVAHTQFAELQARPAAVEDRALKLAEVLAHMRSATVPGNTLGDVLGAARSAYERADMADEWTLHHQGGTIGYQARERIATPGDLTIIEPGMAFAWNPSAIGYKLEETLYLDSDGGRHVLTTTPI